MNMDLGCWGGGCLDLILYFKYINKRKKNKLLEINKNKINLGFVNGNYSRETIAQGKYGVLGKKSKVNIL